MDRSAVRTAASLAVVHCRPGFFLGFIACLGIFIAPLMLLKCLAPVRLALIA
jgi:hypothetical protein